MRYDTPAAFRAALDATLANRAREGGVDLQRLRRRVVFERLLVRLDLGAPDRWIVKGGMALEVRLGDRARSTRDLDLALRDADTDGDVVRELVIDCVSHDVEDDWFAFLIGPQRSISPDDAGRPGWRFEVNALLGGQTFARVRLEVVARADEITKTRRVALPGALDFVGLPARSVEIVDPEQHFAEKMHALTRTYGDWPNSRVRDLPDLVLLIEDGLQPTPGLRAVVAHVFTQRATHELPRYLPNPPAFWRDEYPGAAGDMDVSATTLDGAMQCVRGFWTRLLTNGEES